jgi:hypothetical protein
MKKQILIFITLVIVLFFIESISSSVNSLVETLKPNAAGTYANWIGNKTWQGASDDKVNSAAATNVPGNNQTFNTTDHTSAADDIINNVTVYGECKRSAASLVGNFLIEGGNGLFYNSSHGSLTPTSTSFVNFSYTWLTDPSDGAAWTVADVNSMEIGAREYSTSASRYLNCSEFWAVVNYSANTCNIPASGNWVIDCSQSCVWTANGVIPANISTIGTGVLNLKANFTFTGTKQYVFINRGCNWTIDRGGGFR